MTSKHMAVWRLASSEGLASSRFSRGHNVPVPCSLVGAGFGPALLEVHGRGSLPPSERVGCTFPLFGWMADLSSVMWHASQTYRQTALSLMEFLRLCVNMRKEHSSPESVYNVSGSVLWLKAVEMCAHLSRERSAANLSSTLNFRPGSLLHMRPLKIWLNFESLGLLGQRSRTHLYLLTHDYPPKHSVLRW